MVDKITRSTRVVAGALALDFDPLDRVCCVLACSEQEEGNERILLRTCSNRADSQRLWMLQDVSESCFKCWRLP